MTTSSIQSPFENIKNTLICVVGPTAIGKTALAIRLAQHYHTQIISADSRQFFKELKIGTAAPTDEEKLLVPHLFAGHLSIQDYYNVSRFEKDALKSLEDVFQNNNIAVLTGGSGLYIDALCIGIDEMPEPDEKIRKEVDAQYREKGIGFFCERLSELDPEYFAIVDQANPNRLKRAIEVCLQTGQSYTTFRAKKTKPRSFDIIKIGLNMPRVELFERISLRTNKMIEIGLVEEVKSLMAFKDLNALNTVGYKEIFQFLEGQISLDRAIENIKTNTRRYAKRQLTWFKRDKELRWFLPENFNDIIDYINTKM